MPERAAQNAPNQVKELKVSGHTMALDPGLYCVFNAPNGQSPALEGGLPGVRITTAPGRQGGAVSLAGFHADGWIGSDSGALVQISGQAAEVLVTVYQALDSKIEAPKLQVVRLAGEAGAAAPSMPAAAAQQGQQAGNVEVVAHIYARGDVAGQLGAWIGEPGSNRWIEGFGISPSNDVPASDLEYQAVLGRGWLSPWSEGGQFCGSRGMSLPILGLRVRLRGESARTHRVVLAASFVDGARIGPVADGDACESPSLAALEAFQVSIEPAKAKAKPARAVPGKTQAQAAPAPPAPVSVEASKQARRKPAAKAAKPLAAKAAKPPADKAAKPAPKRAKPAESAQPSPPAKRKPAARSR